MGEDGGDTSERPPDFDQIVEVTGLDPEQVRSSNDQITQTITRQRRVEMLTIADLLKLECYHSSLEVNRPRLNWNLVLRPSPKIPVLLEVLIFRSAIMISLVGEQSFIGHKDISHYHSVRVRGSGGLISLCHISTLLLFNLGRTLTQGIWFSA